VCVCLYVCTLVHVCMCVAGPEAQGRAGKPPVAHKPREVRIAAGGASSGYTEGGAQNSPVVLQKAVTVQSSRPPPAASAKQGREKLDSHHQTRP
jgi:hypothetical protein